MSNRWLVHCTIAPITILLAAAAGCGESPTAPGEERLLEISTTQGEYVPGDLIETSVRNIGSSPVSVSFCDVQLQRRTLLGWQTIRREDGLPCLDILYTLQPGDTRQFWYDLPALLAAGAYRLHLPNAFDEVETQLTITQRMSNEFEVRAQD